MKNILVGIDLKENTPALIKKAAEMATAFNAKIWLLHVSAPEPDFVGYGVGPQYIRDARAEDLKDEHKLIASFVEELEKQTIEADGLLIQGPTIEMLLAEAKKLAIDLIVTGHQEHNVLYNFLFGDTTAELIKKANIPVLVVPFE